MNRVFEAGRYFTVPDGTDVSAFLNATDVTQQELPWDALGDLSIASGRVRSGVHSWVHIHPAVTQVTYVVTGALTVRMKEPDMTDFYDLHLEPGQAIVVQPGTLFQLRNDSDGDAYVLYIVSPSYIFHMEGDEVVYDDAILVSSSWEDLLARDYEIPEVHIDETDLHLRREAARQLVKRRKEGTRSQPEMQDM
jgi:mannose-6-phosphate isomerase-like protein (cupin superfamily)